MIIIVSKIINLIIDNLYYDNGNDYHDPGKHIITGWWCNNHLEKYESQWEGFILYIMEK